MDSTKLSNATSHIANFTGKESEEKRLAVFTGNKYIFYDSDWKYSFSPDKQSAFENANFSKTASS